MYIFEISTKSRIFLCPIHGTSHVFTYITNKQTNLPEQSHERPKRNEEQSVFVHLVLIRIRAVGRSLEIWNQKFFL
jgi:hypothetical protein